MSLDKKLESNCKKRKQRKIGASKARVVSIPISKFCLNIRTMEAFEIRQHTE